MEQEYDGVFGQIYEAGDKAGEFYPLELDRFDFLREEESFVK